MPPTSAHRQRTAWRAPAHAVQLSVMCCIMVSLSQGGAAALQARESRLRKAGLPARARMAAELRDMDTDILTLTRTLAV